MSIICRSNRDFPELVLQKLLSQFTASLKSGDVLVARNLLRVLSCLASTKTLSLEGNAEEAAGFISILQLLCSIAESEKPLSSELSIRVEAAIFLLASSVPYFANVLYESTEFSPLLHRISEICKIVAPLEGSSELGSRCSRYDVGGSHAVFHVSIEGTIPPACADDPTSMFSAQCTSPPGAVCWDSLWEVNEWSFIYLTFFLDLPSCG